MFKNTPLPTIFYLCCRKHHSNAVTPPWNIIAMGNMELLTSMCVKQPSVSILKGQKELWLNEKQVRQTFVSSNRDAQQVVAFLIFVYVALTQAGEKFCLGMWISEIIFLKQFLSCSESLVFYRTGIIILVLQWHSFGKTMRKCYFIPQGINRGKWKL